MTREWDYGPDDRWRAAEVLAWRYRRWRARHYVYAADLAYRRNPTPTNGAAWARAIDYLNRVEAGYP